MDQFMRSMYDAHVASLAKKGSADSTFTVNTSVATLLHSGLAVIDSGANCHIFSDLSLFTSFTPFQEPTKIALAGAGPEGSSLSIEALGEGSIKLLTHDSPDALTLWEGIIVEKGKYKYDALQRG
jgi:hypothetical protein